MITIIVRILLIIPIITVVNAGVGWWFRNLILLRIQNHEFLLQKKLKTPLVCINFICKTYFLLVITHTRTHNLSTLVGVLNSSFLKKKCFISSLNSVLNLPQYMNIYYNKNLWKESETAEIVLHINLLNLCFVVVSVRIAKLNV